MLKPCGYQLTRMCSSRSAVRMCRSSGERRKQVSSEACPRTSVPFDGFSCEVSAPRLELPGAEDASGAGAGSSGGWRG